MKSIKEIMDSPTTGFTGSSITKSMVEEQIKEKYGESELKNLDCYHNLRTFQSWLKLGWKVRKGEKAIRSITFVESNDLDDKTTRKYRRPVFLFYYRQVEKVT